MALSERLAIIISANGSQAISEFNKVGKAADRSLATTEQKMQRVGSTMTRVGAGMTVFGAVVTAGFMAAARASEEQTAANIRLENTIANQPALAGASADAFYDQASALQDVTKFGDEVTVSAQAMLGQFGLNQDQMLELIPLVQDYAAKTGTDLVTAARNVGKATAGTNTTLKRAGVQFDETAFAADHFGATVQALSGYAGGFAEQEGATFSGQMEIIKNQLGEIAEGVGAGAARAFSDMLGPVQGLSRAFTGMSPGMQGTIGAIGAFAGVGITTVGVLSLVTGGCIKAAANLRVLGSALGGIPALFDKAAIAAYEFSGAITSTGSAAAVGGGQLAAIGVAAAGAGLVMQELGSQALDAWGRLTGLFRIQVDTSFWDGFGDGVRSTTGALGGAVGALAAAEGGIAGVGGAAEVAAAAIDELSAEIDAYLSGLFSVPDAQRKLGESFAAMTEAMTAPEQNWNDMAVKMENVVRATADVIGAQVEQGASQAVLDTTIQTSIGNLRQMRNQGVITGAQFVALKTQILGVPHQSVTQTSAPGAVEATSQMGKLHGAVIAVPGSHNTYVSASGAEYAAGQARNVASAVASIDRNVTVYYKSVGSVIPPSGHYASGTPSAPPGLAWVGEQGPELMALQGGERIWSATQSKSVARGGSGAAVSTAGRMGAPAGGSQITVNVNGTATKADGQAVVDALIRWQRSNGALPVRTRG